MVDGAGEAVSSRSELKLDRVVGVFGSSSKASSLISWRASGSSSGRTRPAESRPFFLRSSERFEIRTL